MSATASAPPTLAGYVSHHLKNFSSASQEKLVDFTVINLDTVFWSVFCGVVGCLVVWLVARKATSGVPGRLQAAVELLVEMADGQARAQIHGDRRFIAPLALTLFIWISLMNCMDFLPVDLFSQIFHWLGWDSVIHYHRAVPTSDLNGTVGISFGVVVLMVYFGIKVKGLKTFLHELFCAPFGAALAPFNFMLNLIEYISKMVSLGMRLWGNMYAGELLFLMIAMLGAFAALSLGGAFLFLGHVIAGAIWAIFHILIVFLQAFIFMMLTLVYLGLAHEGH
ncbi:MAG: F0F1 ATP synthase subunit A [Burkholderiaceae bacterium]|jgi:F-type H+-transporting ATPase subunit a|nr:F0F1 ATP synthase subunit A [Burkholderiaceae bacterium]